MHALPRITRGLLAQGGAVGNEWRSRHSRCKEFYSVIVVSRPSCNQKRRRMSFESVVSLVVLGHWKQSIDGGKEKERERRKERVLCMDALMHSHGLFTRNTARRTEIGTGRFQTGLIAIFERGAPNRRTLPSSTLRFVTPRALSPRCYPRERMHRVSPIEPATSSLDVASPRVVAPRRQDHSIAIFPRFESNAATSSGVFVPFFFFLSLLTFFVLFRFSITSQLNFIDCSQ